MTLLFDGALDFKNAKLFFNSSQKERIPFFLLKATDSGDRIGLYRAKTVGSKYLNYA
jgi:hypothetical protein